MRKQLMSIFILGGLFVAFGGSKAQAHGVVHYVGEGVEKTAVGIEHVGKGVVNGTEYVARKSTHATVHCTEAGGHKVVHLVKHIGKAM